MSELYARCIKGSVARTERIGTSNVNIDYHKDGRVIGVEVLDALSVEVDGRLTTSSATEGVQRYDLTDDSAQASRHCESHGSPMMEPDSEGEWVKWADVLAALDAPTDTAPVEADILMRCSSADEKCYGNCIHLKAHWHRKECDGAACGCREIEWCLCAQVFPPDSAQPEDTASNVGEEGS